MELDLTDLLAQATQMLPLAHCPYSHYSVGCALLDSNGDIFVGCNVENASFGATICAERVAMTSAIAHGSHNWLAMAIVSDGRTPFPCGICRQFASEFVGADFVIICRGSDGVVISTTLGQLLPQAF